MARIMHGVISLSLSLSLQMKFSLELNRADDKIITARYCMNKKWRDGLIRRSRWKENENQIPYETVEIWKLGRIDPCG